MAAPHTVPRLLEQAATRFADRPAIIDGDRSLTYAGLAAEVLRTSRGLRAIGVSPGDRVAVWAPNRTEFALALLGAQCLGASLVPLNTRYRGHEARAVLERSGAGVLVVADGFLDTHYTRMLRESAPAGGVPGGGPVAGLPRLHTVVDLEGGDEAGTLAWADLLARGREVPEAEVTALAEQVTPDTVCDILFTSGTTGRPKGVMSSHRQTIGVASVWASGAALTDEDRYAVINPFFHSFGYKAGLIAACTAGAAVYPVPVYTPESLMGLIERARITVLPGAPTIFLTLINHPRRSAFDLSSLRFAIAGAATVPPSLFQQMRDVLGFDTVAQAYGLTECVVATQSRPGEDPRHVAETTGPGVAGIEVRVVDALGHDVPVGADGEVLLRGENVMLGYFEDPVATDEAIDPDGWLHTGDVGRLDEHGCLKITDRIKDMFTVGGFNVYPAEVEHVLSGHPDVVEAAVVGVPDERLGFVGRAYVTLRPGADLDEAALTAYCRERLANFKVPREVTVLSELPRNASGKVLKKDLR
ncbi:AMP-binding protein [Nocardioides sp. cx-173]|uniref:AMP-binding protein n=1 Tax=Nocardioides sp. cx-173 TaxID=2898796 RepID=UPI001E48250A|nr:AMP-binding protein [Nocardioides sp. cx-173]MCD4524130.1 AMP-binding protein [Nocardioides sp. cx-173]UGB41526.1 AMP-binding protein [Nocardioides sp. cx-173]